MRRTLTTFLTLTMLSSVGCATMVGQAAPDFELSALNGNKVKLSDLKGKPVLLAFFGAG